ncbi:MAG TPA: glutamine--fructose-6-phosphate transaminase (isomerizing), partial [Candidatus Nanoarchaeia archaeon]|nr:glutamine--fructose-6-phosphate transaminase (isomerizing) [Candidatus Nanoarchaeia archaeon]
FSSETDSEVLVHLIAQNYLGSLKEAVVKILPKLKGAYAFCVIKKDSEEIVGARNGSPLVVGVGQNENFLSSDVSGIIDHTKNVVYLNDFQITSIIKNKIEIYNFEGEPQEFKISKVDWNLEQSQKQGYKHFMLKEIFEQPKIISDSLKVNCSINFIPRRILVVACGTANYAGLVGKYIIEQIAKIPVIVEVASEFRYKDSLLNNEDLVLAISQSGETADTLAAIRLAKEHGAKTLGIINVVDSTIAREVDEVIYTRAGLEIGVASTKAFISQLVLLYKLAYHLAGKEFPPVQIGRLVEEVLGQNEKIKELAAKYFNYQNFMYIGRHFNFPLSLEGALKLKEVSYIHAEAYPAGELKHGPIALVSEEMPTLAICPKDKVYTKTFNNIEEIKARNGKVITIATIGDETIKKISDDIIYVPEIEESFYPFVITIPLQLFAYHIANLKECDVDKPRNLAKSVTVE